jgi:hypothetical protein
MVNPSPHLCDGIRGPDHLEACADHPETGGSSHLGGEDVDVVTALDEKTRLILHHAILARGRT